MQNDLVLNTADKGFFQPGSAQWFIDLGASHACPCGCTFCFLKQNGKPMNFYQPFQDARSAIIQVEDGIRAGRGMFIVGTTPEVDVFSNPHILDILRIFGERYPNYLFSLSTNGCLISEDWVREIKRWRNLSFWLSVHSLNDGVREKISVLNNRPVVEKLLDGMLGIACLEPFWSLRTFRDDMKAIRDCGFKGSILVRRIEHTKYSSPETVEMSKASCDNYIKALEYAYEHDSDVHALPIIPDFKPIRKSTAGLFLNEDMNELRRVLGELDGPVLVLTSSFAHKWIKKSLPGVDVEAIANRYYGGSIECAGLLVRDDLLYTLNGIDVSRYSHILLPSAMKSVLVLEGRENVHPVDRYEDMVEYKGAKIHFVGDACRVLI